MGIELTSGLSEFGFGSVRTLFKYLNFLSNMPYVKYVAFGCGSFVVFVKGHATIKSWKRTKKWG